MQLKLIDWVVVAAYAVLSLAIGLRFARRAGRSLEQYFLSGRTAPWWLLGTSMVATTFSADTPNLVTDLVRTGGVSTNWLWWAFLITGMLTVFFYAKLLAAERCAHRHQFLRAPLLGRAGKVPARLPRRLSRRVLQHRDHGHSDARRHQDCGCPARARPLHHRRARRAFDHGLRHHLRGYGACWLPTCSNSYWR